MSLKKNLLITASFALSLAFALPVSAQAESVDASSPKSVTASSTTDKTSATPDATKSKDTSPVTHAEFESLLKDTMMNNPEILIDVMKKLRANQELEARNQLKEAMAKRKADLFNDTKSPRVGDAKEADTTLVEFFDYHCGYCKRMLPTITQIVNEDKKVQIIFREFPILSEDSVYAARAAIAAYNIDKGKYFDFHTELMKTSGKFDEKSIDESAKKVGIDAKKLHKEMENPDITKQLDDNRALAEDLHITGTPAVVIGDQVLPGAVSHDDLAKMIDNVRKGLAPDAGLKSAEPSDKKAGKNADKKDTDKKEDGSKDSEKK